MSISPEQASEVLKSALNLWWLRPENGLALASYTLRGASLIPKSDELAMDVACGDGVNTFFKCGGRFGSDFDLFLSGIKRENASTVAKKRLDVFDHFEAGYAPTLLKKPTRGYDVGTDHKEALVKKSAALGFYERLHVADMRNEISEADASFDLVYCNSLYWVAETQKALQLMMKKMKPKGRIILDFFTTDKAMLDYSKLFPTFPEHWHELMNRGRQETNPGLRPESGWVDLFKSAGLKTLERNVILPAGLVWMWNVGMRPIFPALQRMAGHLNGPQRAEVKEEWIDIWHKLLLPILLDPAAIKDGEKPIRLQYVLTPN